jgi:hypothetical protein
MDDYIPYEELLKDKRWQKKRQIILNRDHHQCKMCSSSEALNVHHRYYIYQVFPWKYPDNALVTLCSSCHLLVHKTLPSKVYMKKDGCIIPMKLTPCMRCGGSGYLTEYKHVKNGICFRCRGEKYEEFIESDNPINIYKYLDKGSPIYDSINEDYTPVEIENFYKEARAFHVGDEEREVNLEKALRLYEIAAIHGFAKAQNNIGLIYEKRGDLVRAQRWYLYSAMQGTIEAKRNTTRLLMDNNSKLSLEWIRLIKDDIGFQFQIVVRIFTSFFESKKTETSDKMNLYYAYLILKRLVSKKYEPAIELMNGLKEKGIIDIMMQIDEVLKE